MDTNQPNTDPLHYHFGGRGMMKSEAIIVDAGEKETLCVHII
jgi:hypothetical protein